MQMRMEKQVLSPTVQYREKADLGAQMLGIGSDGGQGLGGGAEENAVEAIFVLVSDGRERFGNGEDDMKIVRVENFGGSFLDPLRTSEGLTFWAMTVAAAVVAGSLVTAAVAALEMTAESGGAAHLDRGHDAPLSRGERRAMLLTIGFTVATKDVRHFQFRAMQGARRLEVLRRGRLDLHRNRVGQQIKGARCRAHFAGRDVQIFCGCLQAAMAEQELNLANVGARFKQVTCKSMTHGMRRDRFRNFGKAAGFPAHLRNRGRSDVLARRASRKEPVPRPFHSPPVPQDL